jgi:hypothetical protein
MARHPYRQKDENSLEKNQYNERLCGKLLDMKTERIFPRSKLWGNIKLKISVLS